MCKFLKRLLFGESQKPTEASAGGTNTEEVTPHFRQECTWAMDQLNRDVLSNVTHHKSFRDVAEMEGLLASYLRKRGIVVKGWVNGEQPSSTLAHLRFTSEAILGGEVGYGDETPEQRDNLAKNIHIGIVSSQKGVYIYTWY